MAQLAQIRFVLADFEVTASNIEILGHLAEDLADRLAVEVYGEGVEIDVVLEEGSLLAKITVIGALAHLADRLFKALGLSVMSDRQMQGVAAALLI